MNPARQAASKHAANRFFIDFGCGAVESHDAQCSAYGAGSDLARRPRSEVYALAGGLSTAPFSSRFFFASLKCATVVSMNVSHLSTAVAATPTHRIFTSISSTRPDAFHSSSVLSITTKQPLQTHSVPRRITGL